MAEALDAAAANKKKELFNSSVHDSAWKAFSRLIGNKKRCPIQLRQRADTHFADAFRVWGLPSYQTGNMGAT